MSASTLLTYCAAVPMSITWVVIAALTFQPGGITGKVQQTRLQQAAAVAFFLSLFALYVDIAAHVFTLVPLIDPAGAVVWDFAAIIVFQAVTVLVSMVSIRRQVRRERRNRS